MPRKTPRSARAQKPTPASLEDMRLDVVHPHAAGIDVGNEVHYAAVHPERDPEGEPVRRFACFTADLEQMALWLKRCDVRTVAMQATGVYWIPLFDTFENSLLSRY